MKSITKSTISFFAFLMLMFVSANSAKAADCSQAVDKMCKTFNLMTAQINSIQSFEDLGNLDLVGAVEITGLEDIIEECKEYVLTTNDKARLVESFNGYIDSVANKMYALHQGQISHEMIGEQLNPMKDGFKEAVSGATTMGNLVDRLEPVLN